MEVYWNSTIPWNESLPSLAPEGPPSFWGYKRIAPGNHEGEILGVQYERSKPLKCLAPKHMQLLPLPVSLPHILKIDADPICNLERKSHPLMEEYFCHLMTLESWADTPPSICLPASCASGAEATCNNALQSGDSSMPRATEDYLQFQWKMFFS